MENYDQQNNQQANQREPLPVFEKPAQPVYQQPVYQEPVNQQPVYQQPVYQQPVYQQPVYQQPVYQQPAYQQPAYQQPIPQLKELGDSAFGKGLAAAIMAEFPVTSIIAIIMGSKAQNLAAQAEAMAARYGVSAGGKCIAGKIMGKIGKIMGIVLTVFYAFYFLLLIAAMG